MILYLDASALVKRYVAERGSQEVVRWMGEAEAVGTASISRTEVAAALAKAARMGILTRGDAESAHEVFREQWPVFIRLPVTEALLERAADLTWDYGLRAYDSVQLGAAMAWREVLDVEIAFASFDRNLWTASSRAGLAAFPDDFPALLASWKQDG
jgi:predicted nucleic acid-binding protein